MDMTKHCPQCNNDLPATGRYFYIELTQVSSKLSEICSHCQTYGKVKKQCNKCFTTYPATAKFFTKDKRGKNGLSQPCKTCKVKKGLRQY